MRAILMRLNSAKARPSIGALTGKCARNGSTLRYLDAMPTVSSLHRSSRFAISGNGSAFYQRPVAACGGYRTDAGRQRTLQNSHTSQRPNFSDFVRQDGASHESSSIKRRGSTQISPQLVSSLGCSCG